MWAPRSPWHQDVPRTSPYGAAVRRAALGVRVWSKQTYLPYLPWRTRPADVPAVRTWQNRIVPVVSPQMWYRGEAPLRLQLEVVLPHTSGLDPTLPLVSGRG